MCSAAVVEGSETFTDDGCWGLDTGLHLCNAKLKPGEGLGELVGCGLFVYYLQLLLKQFFMKVLALVVLWLR